MSITEPAPTRPGQHRAAAPVEVSHRQLAELQRTLATKATQLEQLSIDIALLLAGTDQRSGPWSALIEPSFRRHWDDHHRVAVTDLVVALEEQARHLGDLRRHLLPAADALPDVKR